MKSLGEFLAHAVVLEEEAAERYEHLATSMSARSNEPAAELFRTMGRFARMHLTETLARARDVGPLPDLNSWEYEWPGGESPEAWALAEEHDASMTPNDALRLALTAEQLAHRFYVEVAQSAATHEVRRLAQSFADEEAGHVAQIERWLAHHPEADEGWDDDLSGQAGAD